MAISFVGATGGASGTGSSGFTVTAPAGTAAGDVIVLFVQDYFYDFTVSPAAGWQQAAAGNNAYVYWHAFAPGDPGSWDFGFTYPSGDGPVYFLAATYSGAGSVASGSALNDYVVGEPSNSMAPSLSGAVAGNVMVAAYGESGPTLGTVSGWTARSVPSGATNFTQLGDVTAVGAGSLVGPQWSGPGGAQYMFAMAALIAPPAPLAPTLTTPTAGAYIDTSVNGVTLAATYNASNDGTNQNAYAIRIKQSGASAYSYWNASSATLQSSIVWNPISTAPGAQFQVTLPAAAVANGYTYNWSAASQESGNGAEGPFASDATFNAQVLPTVVVTAPAGTVDATPSAAWTTTPAAGAAQTTWRACLYSEAQYTASGFTPGTSAATWDSGVVAGNAQTSPIDVVIANFTTYRLYVQVTETGGETSAWEYSSFTTNFDPPATPTIIATPGTAPTGLPLITLTVQGHDNLLSADDASLEGSIGTWTAGANWTVTQDTTHALDGTHALKCARQNTTAGGGTASTGLYAVTSQPYTAMASICADTTSAGLQYALAVVNQAGTTIATTTVTLGAAGTWTAASVAFTPTATSTQVRLVVSDTPQTAPASGQLVWVDEAGLFPGVPTAWTRGGLVGAVQITVTRDDGLQVRGASTANPAVMPASQVLTLIDAEIVPTNPHSWTPSASAAAGTPNTVTINGAPSNTVTLPGGQGFWEFDPTDLSTAVAAQMTEYNPQITEQSAAHMVLGQRTLNVIASAMGGIDGTATFETFDAPTYQALSALLTSQTTIFISDPFGDNAGVTYVRFGPQTGGMSTGNGNQTKSANLHPSTASGPHHTLSVSWIAQPRPPV